MSIESVMPSNHLILCHPLLLLPSTFPSIRVRRRAGAHRLLRGPAGREPVPTASQGDRGQHFPPHWPPHRRHMAGAASASWQSGRGWLADCTPGRRYSGVLCSPWTLRRTHLSPAELLWPMFSVSWCPLQGWGLGISSALSLAEHAGFSEWSLVLLLAVPQGPASCLLSPPCSPGWRDPPQRFYLL